MTDSSVEFPAHELVPPMSEHGECVPTIGGRPKKASVGPNGRASPFARHGKCPTM